MKLKELLLQTLLPTLEVIGESKLVEALAALKANDPVAYKAAVEGGTVFCEAILPIVKKSKTPIDDAILTSLIDALAQSEANDLNLE